VLELLQTRTDSQAVTDLWAEKRDSAIARMAVQRLMLVVVGRFGRTVKAPAVRRAAQMQTVKKSLRVGLRWAVQFVKTFVVVVGRDVQRVMTRVGRLAQMLMGLFDSRAGQRWDWLLLQQLEQRVTY
jgi:hypothetical protein